MWARIDARRLLPVVLFVIAAMYLVSRGGISPSVLDLGFEASSARRVADGQVPHRDFFTLLPPVHFLLTGATVRMLGVSMDSLVLFASLVGAGISVAVFGIVRRTTGALGPALAAWTAVPLFSLGDDGHGA